MPYIVAYHSMALRVIVLYAIPQRMILIGEAIADTPYTQQTLILGMRATCMRSFIHIHCIIVSYHPYPMMDGIDIDGDERVSASLAPYQPYIRSHRWQRVNGMMTKPTSHGVLAPLPDSSFIWAGTSVCHAPTLQLDSLI